MDFSISSPHDLVKSFRQRVTLPASRTSFFLWMMAILAAGIVVLPILYLVLRVTTAEDLTRGLLSRASTLHTLARTIWLAIAVTMACVAISIPLAWLTTRSDIPLRRTWAVLTALPLVIPSYVGAYLFVASLGPRGVFSHLLRDSLGGFHLPSIYGFPGALYVLTLLSYPYILLSVRPALQWMDPSLEEASRSLGYSSWKTFWRITLPQLRPAITAGSLLVILYILRDFGAVSIMRYNTFTRVIYLQYHSAFDRTAAAALSLVLVLLTMGILVLEGWARRGGRTGNVSSATSRPSNQVRLGRWRWPALIYCAGVVTLSLVAPAAVLIYWLVRGLQTGETLRPLWETTVNSFAASGLAAFFTLLFALPVAILSVRRPGPTSLALERTSYTGYALPGLVVALALVFFSANSAPILYQTLPLLTLAYIALFLPQAVAALRSALLRIHPDLEEAARGLGRRQTRVFTSITLPLAQPGVLAAISMVFLTTMKELPATLILAPIGFKTLAIAVWANVSEVFFAQAALPALLLILVSSFPLAILMFWDRK